MYFYKKKLNYFNKDSLFQFNLDKLIRQKTLKIKEVFELNKYEKKRHKCIQFNSVAKV